MGRRILMLRKPTPVQSHEKLLLKMIWCCRGNLVHRRGARVAAHAPPPLSPWPSEPPAPPPSAAGMDGYGWKG